MTTAERRRSLVGPARSFCVDSCSTPIPSLTHAPSAHRQARVPHVESGSGAVYAQQVMAAVKPVEATAVATRAVGAPPTSAGVQATLAVLDLLAARRPLGLSEMSRELGIAKSTLHRDLRRARRARLGRAGRRRVASRPRDPRAPARLVLVRAPDRGRRSRPSPRELLTRHDETDRARRRSTATSRIFVAIEETSHPVAARHARRQRRPRPSRRPAVASCSRRCPPAAIARDVRRQAPRDADRQAAERRRRAASILDEVRERGYAENRGGDRRRAVRRFGPRRRTRTA